MNFYNLSNKKDTLNKTFRRKLWETIQLGDLQSVSPFSFWSSSFFVRVGLRIANPFHQEFRFYHQCTMGEYLAGKEKYWNISKNPTRGRELFSFQVFLSKEGYLFLYVNQRAYGTITKTRRHGDLRPQCCRAVELILLDLVVNVTCAGAVYECPISFYCKWKQDCNGAKC